MRFIRSIGIESILHKSNLWHGTFYYNMKFTINQSMHTCMYSESNLCNMLTNGIVFVTGFDNIKNKVVIKSPNLSTCQPASKWQYDYLDHKRQAKNKIFVVGVVIKSPWTENGRYFSVDVLCFACLLRELKVEKSQIQGHLNLTFYFRLP